MGAIESHLPEIWLFIIGFFLLYYAINDGADLGVGIISLATPDERERSIMMGSIGSIWADNQSWLVVLGGMLFGAFPIFYSVILPALYIPILLMLVRTGFPGSGLRISREFTASRYLEPLLRSRKPHRDPRPGLCSRRVAERSRRAAGCLQG